MTDTERDQIDQDAQTFMRTCSEAIQQLRTQGEGSERRRRCRPLRLPGSAPGAASAAPV